MAFDVVIGNPPFNKWLQFLHKSCEIVQPNGFVAMVLPMRFIVQSIEHALKKNGNGKLVSYIRDNMRFREIRMRGNFPGANTSIALVVLQKCSDKMPTYIEYEDGVTESKVYEFGQTPLVNKNAELLAPMLEVSTDFNTSKVSSQQSRQHIKNNGAAIIVEGLAKNAALLDVPWASTKDFYLIEGAPEFVPCPRGGMERNEWSDMRVDIDGHAYGYSSQLYVNLPPDKDLLEFFTSNLAKLIFHSIYEPSMNIRFPVFNMRGMFSYFKVKQHWRRLNKIVTDTPEYMSQIS